MYWWIPGSNPPVYMGCMIAKFKLKSSGYRLVYQVDEVVMVFVVAIGNERNQPFIMMQINGYSV
jgi:hypothetical protein